MSVPKVFISHSWDDKKRFVLEFAKKLLSRGIDAWVDEWEMVAGDSLIKKIFCEGIHNADAFIIVLSRNSIQKKWVKEELDLAVIKKIEEGSRIIPIIIDECEVPGPLRSTIWVKIHDLNNYQNEFEKIVMAIFGQTTKPPIGSPPKYTSSAITTFSGLNEIDSIIFNAICEKGVELHKEYGISADQVFNNIKQYEIEEEIFAESLSVLAYNYLIKILGGARVNCTIDLTRSGLNKYIDERVPEFFEIEKSIICELINKGINSKGGKFDFGITNEIYLHHVLKNLSDQNLISYGRTLGNTAIINRVSQVLKRVSSEKYD